MKDTLTTLYASMCQIRCVETTLLELFSLGHLRGTVHTCLGQEACAAGVVHAIDRNKDIIYSNHRGHGHYLAYCNDVRGLIAEVMGLPQGVCSGRGGSQHLHRQNFYTNGIQGAGVPVIAGMALAEKMKGSRAIGVIFLGDGTFGEGTVYEAMNIASLWKLPVLFAVEHNGYAQSTSSSLQHAGELADRAKPFGIPVTEVDGMDVEVVHAAALRLITGIRQTSEPQLLFLRTYRFGPHSKGDDHRDADEIFQAKIRDPLLLGQKNLGDEAALSISQTIQAEVAQTVKELLALK